VDDLLDVSRMVRGQITLQREPVTLADVVQIAVETSRPLIRRRRHQFAVQLPEQSVLIEGDLTRLAQVISNLLNNAAKYTDDGGHIRLDADLDGGMIAIRVRDTGLGVAPNLLPHVFDLFTQADRTLDRAEGGLGIGLTLVKRLVELHGGNVEARSEGLGRGAEFIVRLPVISTQPGLASESAVRESAPQAETEERNLRILIVDDNVDAADSIAMLLGMEGHQTVTVNTARAALLAAPEFKPDVVLLDIGLPEMDGYEVARRLRAQNGSHAMRLVAVTGYGQPADRRRARAAGFDEHMVKPVEPAMLQAFLRSVPPGS
jgi:CheY-like chemotaxis protein/anti-sigma regulatory factor (Ser/Thr protein kinase)